MTLSAKDLLQPFSVTGAYEEKVGLELEKFLLDAKTLLPLSVTGKRSIQELCQQLVDHYHWMPCVENGLIISLERGHELLSLEPGGQLELSSVQDVFTDHAFHYEQAHLKEIKALTKDWDIITSGLGMQPFAKVDEIEWLEKERYKVMRAYLPTKGKLAAAMMKQTSSLQVSLDFKDEADACKKFQTLIKLSPLLTALFSNSCFSEGKPNGYKSYRAYIWQYTDADRCGVHPLFFEKSFSFQHYVEYALDVPMFFLIRDGKVVVNKHQTFRNFLQNGFEKHEANSDDWNLHLSTLFPEIRLKSFLEVRSCDRQACVLAFALPVLLKSLVYDEEALNDLSLLLDFVDVSVCREALTSAAKEGMQGMFGPYPFLECAAQVMKLARSGLERLKLKKLISPFEEKAFAQLEEMAIIRKSSPADLLLSAYEKGKNLRDIVLESDLFCGA
ncbi:MAG: hypothetical protein COX62_03760 [Deltaproteobacteria bacterium CG_4_10_14_0_2_um_filter_43_8]|nr:MAG: hypothetical protein COV43_03820 [Deltaproteobacteria bacterium CG11_big_fil_rev_8_21_14_0_20_42_23]PJA20934.1 MAG: hypothetical protein COX62_03760 [Deltaproteobacteria bacterium CG_4_10_14_0_2_um_filter_43_8]PJC63364.1 MAG: hypothetical protein CO021_09790 [Deltaproteobacteria bacterium CG_4_9_14_0_2_um_filter_42_21]